ncbi:hypothetical protein lerEdw1_010224, partial [Lerista edwardsae]
MDVLLLLCVLSKLSWCWEEDARSKYLTECSVPGILPPPELFLNASSAQEGDFVSAHCKTPVNISSTRIFFCKDGLPLATQQYTPGNIIYTFSFSVTQQNGSLYSCGYQKKYSNNQVTHSILSAPWKLTVLSGIKTHLGQFNREKEGAWTESNALFAAHWCLNKDVDGDPNLEHCNSNGLPNVILALQVLPYNRVIICALNSQSVPFIVVGELPAPVILLNKTSAHEGDWISIRCAVPGLSSVTKYFFCKDGLSIKAVKAMAAYTAAYALHVSQESAGLYSCGYQHKDENNQEKNSAFSEPRQLIVLPRNPHSTNGSSNSTVGEWAVIPGVAGFGVLTLAPSIYFLIKKGAFLATHCCLAEGEDTKGIGLCSSAGNHNLTSRNASSLVVCHQRPSSVGQYSCGYQLEDEKKQKKSALSAARTLIVLPDSPVMSSGNDNKTGNHDQPSGNSSNTDALLFATHGFSGDGAGDTNAGLCNSRGELPAPTLFVSAESAWEGDWISMRCLASNTSVTTFFFCKNNHPIFAHRPLPHQAVSTFPLQILQNSVGQYSCGYQQEDEKNQEKMSALSAARSLVVLPGNQDQSSGNSSNTDEITFNFTVEKWKIISGVAGFAILILIPLIYLLIKKVVPHQRSSRGEAPNKNKNNMAAEGQLESQNVFQVDLMASDGPVLKGVFRECLHKHNFEKLLQDEINCAFDFRYQDSGFPQEFGALFVTYNSLEEGASAKDLGLCSGTGELPAPEMFLNATSAQAGAWVSVRCMLPDIFVTKYFFCRNRQHISVHQAIPREVAYTRLLQITEQSAGQYSCGYQLKDEKNQEHNSVLSAAW